MAYACAACGRIGFDGATAADAAAPDAAIAVVLASDDFGRVMSGGWGSADVGGAWSVFNPPSSAISVVNSRADVRLSSGTAYVDAHLTGATALDVQTSAVVSFDAVPTSRSFHAAVSTRWVADTPDYRAHVELLAGGSADIYIEVGTAQLGYTTLANASAPIALDANVGLALSVTAIGADPTTVCGKAWLVADVEPSACTVSSTDGTAALQVPGSSYLITYGSGGPAPTVSFGTFRFLRVGPD